MLFIRQTSAFSGFRYHAFDAMGGQLAEIVWPTVAQASNARLKWHAQGSPDADVQIRMPQGLWRIGFEYLSRGFHNESRFTLHQTGEPLAVADVLLPENKRQRQRLVLHQPFSGRLVRTRQWARVRYLVEREGQTVGCVEEPDWFSWRRELRVDLPVSLPVPVRLFIGFMVINASFR